MSRVLDSETEGQTASTGTAKRLVISLNYHLTVISFFSVKITVGPIYWMSPEALSQRYSEKSGTFLVKRSVFFHLSHKDIFFFFNLDVWAYGVTLWEVRQYFVNSRWRK